MMRKKNGWEQEPSRLESENGRNKKKCNLRVKRVFWVLFTRCGSYVGHSPYLSHSFFIFYFSKNQHAKLTSSASL